MDLNQTVAIAVSALDAQRQRLNVIASNLANVHSTQTPEGGPYRRRDVVFRSYPMAPRFENALRHVTRFNNTRPLEGVRISRVIQDQRPPQTVYEPTHPDADEKGFVQKPNVNVLEEMVNMMAASRAYEANVQAIKAVRSMLEAAMDIGR